MSITLMWFAPPVVAVLAQGLGVPGLDAVEAVRTRGSDEQFDRLVDGGCDAVITAMDNVFAWNRRPGPADFCIVAQIERTTPLALVGRPELRQLADLRGARLLVDAPENGFVIALRALLLQAGLGARDYRLIESGGVQERLDALLAGQGDATLLGPVFDAAAVAAGQTVIARVQESYPDFPGQGLVVRRSVLPRIRTALMQWLGALEHARQGSAADPDRAVTALQQAGGVDAAGAAAMLRVLPASLHPSRPGFERLRSMRRELGLAGAPDRYEALVDSSLLP